MIEERRDQPTGGPGAPLSRAAMSRERTAEAYLYANEPPRWMQRLLEIERGIDSERRALAGARGRLLDEHGGTGPGFDRAWAERLRTWMFDPELNELIRTHNEWYPVERQLPMDPRTGDYVLVGGRTYLRPELDVAWALAQFPD